MTLKSKICGVSDSKTLSYLINHTYPPQFVGFIVNYPKSKRFIETENLKSLINVNKNKTKFVAVLVKPDETILKKIVLHQARLASKAKLDAIVCSAQEVNIVRKVFKKEIITPGIRFNSKKNDQKRTFTPKQAFKNGSDWLVIGRPITKGNIKKNINRLIDHLKK